MPVVHFKDGSSKEYMESPKEYRDFVDSAYESDRIEKRINEHLDYMFGGEDHVDRVAELAVSKGVDTVGVARPIMHLNYEFFRALGYEVVGHGIQTNADCGRYVRSKACLNVDLHVEHPNQIFSHKIHHHCNNFRCPVCYYFGAGIREAKRIEKRLDVFSKLLNKDVEHGMIQVDKRLWSLPEKLMRQEASKALVARGWIGFNLIFHPLRYKSSHWIKGVLHLAGSIMLLIIMYLDFCKMIIMFAVNARIIMNGVLRVLEVKLVIIIMVVLLV